MTTEDFSFPTENVPSCIESPPLWHSSPAASSSDSHQEETAKELEEVRTERRRFSCIENGQKIAKRDGNEEEEEDQEETMDLLWENFNEELSRSQSSLRANSEKFSGDQIVAMGRVNQTLTFSRTKDKPPMFMVLKVLRKLFMLHNHNSHHHHHHQHKLKTSRAWSSC